MKHQDQIYDWIVIGGGISGISVKDVLSELKRLNQTT